MEYSITENGKEFSLKYDLEIADAGIVSDTYAATKIPKIK